MEGNGRVVNPNTPLDPVRVTVDEAAALQSVPPDFVWDAEYVDDKGRTRKVANTKKYLIIGNAEPPLLAQCVLESLWAPTRVVDNVIAFPKRTEHKAAA